MNETGHGTSGGVELTDALLDQLAKEAEQGYDVARLGRGRRRGRPPIGEKAATIFQVRIEPDLRELLEGAADAEETTPSDIVRRALRAYLPTPAKQNPTGTAGGRQGSQPQPTRTQEPR